jgi:hypothetical protein
LCAHVLLTDVRPPFDRARRRTSQRTRAVFKLRYGIAAMGEPAVGVCCGHRRQGMLDRSRQRLSGTGLGDAPVGLELRPGALDRRQSRRIRRPGEALGASPRNARANGGALMSAQKCPTSTAPPADANSAKVGSGSCDHPATYAVRCRMPGRKYPTSRVYFPWRWDHARIVSSRVVFKWSYWPRRSTAARPRVSPSP